MRIKILAALIAFLVVSAVAFGQEYQVDEVLVEGTRRVEQSAVEAVLTAKAGQSLSRADIDRDIRAIFALGRFQDVVAEVSDRDGVTVLAYRLTERPLVRKVVFTGNDEFKEDKLRELSTLKTPNLFNPNAVDESIEAIKKAYLAEGFYAVAVTSEVDIDEENEASIAFTIDEGEKVLVRHISFEGNTVFSEKQLRKAIETKEKWFLSWLTGRGTYQEEVIQNDLEIVADQYYNEGYVQVKVRQPLVALSEDKKYLDLLIEIEEGAQFTVGELDAQGDLLKSKDEILSLVKLQAGDVFSRKKLRESVFAVNDMYADQGYAYVNVSPLTNLDPSEQRINLTIDIEQGVQVVIDRVIIGGNTKTRDKVIRREMQMVEGDLYSATGIKKSRRKINNLGFFEEVNVTTAKGSDESHMDVHVDVKERPTGTFSLGFGYSSVDKFIGQGSVSQDNFLGRALKLNLAASFGGSSTTYQVGIFDPYFLDKNLGLGFDIYNTEREWSDFSKKTTGGDIKLGFPVAENTRGFLMYKYEDKEIFDVDEDASRLIRDQEGTSTLSSLFASLTKNTTDYRLDPSRGYVAEGSVEFAGLGGTEKFVKTVLDYRHFWPFKWGTVFTAHGQVGHIQEIGGEEIPIDERFFLGGINSLRGFNSREVGPRVRQVTEVAGSDGEIVEDEDFEFIGGDKEAYFNLEYIFPLVKDLNLKGLVFFDTGNAWGEDEEFFDEMRYSAGGGIRWFSPMGPLRLEWGYNLDAKEDEDKSKFEFSIGKFF